MICHRRLPIARGRTSVRLVIPRPGSRRPLLNYVRQLMREELFSAACSGSVLRRAEHDIAANRVSQRIHVARRLDGARIGMDAHTAEVLPKPRLEEGARI
jgi:hypothetical protein